MDFELDRRGLATILRSQDVAEAVHQLAEEVATNVRNAEPDANDVVVDDYQTDRAASSVTVRDVRARVWQARDGLLTRAAANAGLEVRSR